MRKLLTTFFIFSMHISATLDMQKEASTARSLAVIITGISKLRRTRNYALDEITQKGICECLKDCTVEPKTLKAITKITGAATFMSSLEFDTVWSQNIAPLFPQST